MKNYFTTQKYVKEFLKAKLRVSDMPLNMLSYKFIVDFELYLRAYKPVDHHSVMGNNTVMKHIERLRKMINVRQRTDGSSEIHLQDSKPNSFETIESS